ncbi:MAG TPA: hypothetical protein VMI34_08200 [Candidatus Bathyarchaeia archaeon]|nr:hypothetical protein [Candidatus Bathyarchaeia archaeon]
MRGFMLGALAGAVVVWYWRDQVRNYLDSKTRGMRGRAVDTLQSVEHTAEGVLDRAKEQVSTTLQAGQDAIRPRTS